ncbi:MAG: envelope stress response membrane protein PspC [Desulfuromusa sp.]
MSQQIYNPHHLYRSRDHQLIGGVSAGIAEYFGSSRLLIRFLTFIALIMFTLPTIVIYGIACFFLKKKPIYQEEQPEEKRFWQSMHRSSKETLNKVHEQFSSAEERVQNMEAYLTSRSYKLDRAFEELRD